jgi:hypothetical protein
VTNDELANAFKALFDEAHAKAEALPDSGFKRRTIERLNVAHEIMDRIRKTAVDEGEIQPMSGGDPSKP